MAAKNHALTRNACRSDFETDQSEAGDWTDQETADGSFKDERLGRRFKTLLSDIGRAIGASLPFVCQDSANTKATYRFLSNERVDEADILSGLRTSPRMEGRAGNQRDSKASSTKW